MSQIDTPTIAKISLEIIASGFFGALAAFCFNKLHWWQTEDLRKTELILSNITTNIEKIENLAIHYWLSEDSTRSSENRKTEIQIKSLFRTQTRLINIIKNTQKENPSHINNLSNIHEELFEITTGELFESRSRVASPAKCNKISKLSADMKLTLIELISL